MPWEEPKSEIATIVEQIPCGIFVREFVKGLGRTSLIGDIVSVGASKASASDKFLVRRELVKFGIPLYLSESDENLDEIIGELFARSVDYM